MQRFGKYEVTRQIGEGGFGRVFEGFDPAIKRRVAIKTCNSAIPDVRERFLREASIAGNLQHRNITVVFDLGEESGTPYLVQEYLSGHDLSELLTSGEALSLATKLSYLTQIARGLGYAHSRGVVHRDIKPSNIRVLEEGTVKIMDFGIAKSSRSDTSLTATGETVGTSTNLSPEQVRAEPIDARCDIYAFGVLAYELLTGRPLYQPGPPQKVIYAILNDPIPAAEEFGDIPARLSATVRRCLQKDPKLRFANCGELLMDLNQVALPSTTISASVTGPTVEYRDLPPGVREGYPPGSRPSDGSHETREHTREVTTPPIETAETSRDDFDTADIELRSGGGFRPLATEGKGTSLSRAGVGTHGGRRLLFTSLVLLALLAVALFAAWKLVPELNSQPGAGVEPTIAERDGSASIAAPGIEGSRPDELAETEPTPDLPAAVDAAPSGTSVRLMPGWDPAIQVSIDGDNAIQIDRERIIALTPGAHFFEFSILRTDYQAFETLELSLEADQRLVLEPPLPRPGRLTVRPTSRSAQVFVRVNGRPLGFTPHQERLLEPGTYQLSLASSGQASAVRTLTVTVESGRETVVEATLEEGVELLQYQRP